MWLQFSPLIITFSGGRQGYTVSSKAGNFLTNRFLKFDTVEYTLGCNVSSI